MNDVGGRIRSKMSDVGVHTPVVVREIITRQVRAVKNGAICLYQCRGVDCARRPESASRKCGTQRL